MSTGKGRDWALACLLCKVPLPFSRVMSQDPDGRMLYIQDDIGLVCETCAEEHYAEGAIRPVLLRGPMPETVLSPQEHGEGGSRKDSSLMRVRRQRPAGPEDGPLIANERRRTRRVPEPRRTEPRTKGQREGGGRRPLKRRAPWQGAP